MIRLGTASYDPSAQLLREGAGARIALRPQSLKVLDCLLKADGSMVGKDELVKTVWGKLAVTDDSLVQCIGEIRAAIGDAEHKVLQTEWRRGYRLVVSVHPESFGSAQDRPVEGLRQTQNEQSVLADGQTYPAIAVMPFVSFDGRERSERNAENFAAALISELARCKELRVISRQTAFTLNCKNLGSKEICEKLHARFLVTGHVQLNGSGIQWSLELVDGHSEEIVWTNRNPLEADLAVKEIQALVSQLAGSILGSYRLFFWQQNIAKPWESLGAYDLASKGYAQLFLGNSPATTRQAHLIAGYAVQKFPDYARSWRLQAHARSFDMNCAHTGEWAEWRVGEALDGIRKAIELEPDNPNSLMVLADLLASNGQFDDAVQTSNRSLELAPADPHVLSMRALLMFQAGRIAEAREIAELYLTAFPIPQPFFYSSYGRILWAMGEQGKALEILQRAVTLAPGSNARTTLVAALHEQGDTRQAAEHFKLLLMHTNGIDESYFGQRWAAIPGIRDRYLAAMRAYGLKRSVKNNQAPLVLVKKA